MNISDAIQLAYQLQHNGKLEEAEYLYKEILKNQPGNAAVYYNLGIIYQDQQRLNEAVSYYEKALQFDANLTDAYFNIGAILYSRGLFDGAIRYFQKALELDPESADINNNLGSALKAKGHIDEAMHCFRRAFELEPLYDSAYNNMGIALKDKGTLYEAITYFEKAFQINPHSLTARDNLTAAYLNFGVAFHDKGNLSEAVAFYKKALEINPGFPDTHYNLGNYYRDKGFPSEALTHYQQCLHHNPDYVEAYNNMGTIYRDTGLLEKAEESFRHAIRLNPYSYSYSNLLLTMLSNPRHDTQSIYTEHRNFAQQCAEHFAPAIPVYANNSDPDRRLNIGYISPDFRRHPVTYFVEPVICAHNRHMFRVFLYSNAAGADEFTRRMQEHADQWCNIVGMSDEKVTESIRKDEIDILVDLTGHTAHNRLLVFARKPAPVQLSWIGYPGTTGLSAIDYKIVDNYTDAPGTTDRFYSEKLIRMPKSFVCYSPDAESPDVGTLPASVTKHITFGSFNFFAKVTWEVCAIWARILERLPNSQLILKDRNFHDKTTREYATHRFTQRGISAERIILQPWDPPPNHLKVYNLVDIGLDTFPFNGLTTTCESLWMGVPVITLEGIAYASRAGVSLLSNVGLPELIAKTKDEYIEIAVTLASDLNILASLRNSLREQVARSPLTDAKMFTAHLETCYRKIWQDWCKSTVV